VRLSDHERGEGGERNILVHQWENEHSFRDELSHHLVFTKIDEEPFICARPWKVRCVSMLAVANVTSPAVVHERMLTTLAGVMHWAEGMPSPAGRPWMR
jgi:hypothetical protein